MAQAAPKSGTEAKKPKKRFLAVWPRARRVVKGSSPVAAAGVKGVKT
jgi:hypothetical protein